jgi:uroporphyrinogen decarboxylase
MDSRERVLRTLRFELPDRPPLDGWFLKSVMDTLKIHFGESEEENILGMLGIDFRSTCMTPSRKANKNYSYFDKLGMSIRIADYFVKKISSCEFEDEWGVRITVTGEGDLDWRYSYHPLGDGEKLSFAKLRIPNLDEPGRFDSVKNDVERWKRSYIVYAGASTLFRKGWLLTGFNRFLEALYTDRAFIEELLERLMDYSINEIKQYIKAGVDVIQFGGDLGSEQSMLLSPKMWREIFKPRMKTIINATKKDGVYFFLHTDGNIQEIIPDLVEIGIDILNPIQPECMNPDEIKNRFGEKLTLHGTFSLQKLFPFGNTEDIEREVLNRVKRCGYNGGLVLAPANAFTTDIPVENILFFYELVKNMRLKETLDNEV